MTKHTRLSLAMNKPGFTKRDPARCAPRGRPSERLLPVPARPYAARLYAAQSYAARPYAARPNQPHQKTQGV